MRRKDELMREAKTSQVLSLSVIAELLCDLRDMFIQNQIQNREEEQSYEA